jgi:hypothetical protein
MSDTDTNTTDPVEPKPLTKAAKKALFASWADAQGQVDGAKAVVEAEEVKASEALSQIHAAMGSGPFRYKGVLFRIVSRNGRCFTRSLGEPDVEDIG